MTDEQTPAAGPLPAESVKLLKPGDLLLVLRLCEDGPEAGSPVRVASTDGPRVWIVGDEDSWWFDRFAFLGRPDQSGWIAWHGGENPVPGVRVDVRFRDGEIRLNDQHSDKRWRHDPTIFLRFHIAAYRPHAPVSRPGDGVEESAGDMLNRLGMDGKLWAEEFQKTAFSLGYPEMDDGWLLGWFCNAVMAGYDHARREYDPTLTPPAEPVSRPAGEGEREAVAILKGVGKITGDGWKDTTTKGEVVFVWNAERPSPYAPGQYPRIGNEGWSASTSQYDFTPATADDVPAILSLLRPAAPDAGGGWMPIETAPKDGREILLYCPQGDGNPGSTYRLTSGQWYETEGGTTEYRDAQGRYIGQDDRDAYEGWVSMDGGFSEETMLPTHWMPLPAPPALQPGGER